MLLSVPGARASLALPAIVTRPFLVPCLYCLWLPRVLTRNQPSSTISLIASLTFTSEDRQSCGFYQVSRWQSTFYFSKTIWLWFQRQWFGNHHIHTRILSSCVPFRPEDEPLLPNPLKRNGNPLKSACMSIPSLVYLSSQTKLD